MQRKLKESFSTAQFKCIIKNITHDNFCQVVHIQFTTNVSIGKYYLH